MRRPGGASARSSGRRRAWPAQRRRGRLGGRDRCGQPGGRAARRCLAALLALAGLAVAVAAAPVGAAAPAGTQAGGGGEGAAPASGAAGSAPSSAARSREAELAALRAEIARLEQRLDRARQQQTGLVGELAAADLALQLEEKRLAEAVAARDEAARRETASAAEVGRLEVALAERRRDFQRQLAGLYRLGRQGYLRLLFLLEPDEPGAPAGRRPAGGGEPRSAITGGRPAAPGGLSAAGPAGGGRLLPAVRLMRFLVRRDREAVDRYAQAKERLARRRDELAAERLDRERWLGWEQAHRRELVVARQRKAAVLARLERERSALQTRAATLADREQKLASFLDLLYGRSTAALAGTPMQQFRGILDWPVQGKVTERFGPRLDPRYRTQVPHNGIDLVTTAGSEVKAVYPGKVLFAAPFEGYGLTAVVHHPGRVFTLYAGLAELKRAKEDMVSLGDIVGLASDRLYFEIRVENHPDDPLSWMH